MSDKKRRLALLGAVVVVAAVVVGVLALASGGDDGPQGLGGGGSTLEGERAVNALFAGIPQRGIAVGDPDAPVTVVEFADLQCPFCAQFARDALPEVVRRYVRTGKVRLELRLLTFIGSDSLRAGQMASAAALQGRGWQFADLFFANQGRENSGYATDEFLREVAGGVDGLDVDQALAQAERPAVGALLRMADGLATQLGVSSTPSFYGRRGDGKLEPLALSELSAAALGTEIDRLLGSG
jgi:protein-disulfide isomerase